jgi:hypothetical protein
MRDAEGLLAGLLAVQRVGARGGYYWHERYAPFRPGLDAPTPTPRPGNQVLPSLPFAYGMEKYCEYPANLIRIVNEFPKTPTGKIKKNMVAAQFADIALRKVPR